MFKIKEGEKFITKCRCKFCGKETLQELEFDYKYNNSQVFRICESCQLNLLTVLHRGVE